MNPSGSEIGEYVSELREVVQSYKLVNALPSPDVIGFSDSLYIGLFGRTGSGKTSLINSLKFAASGRLRRARWLQVATQEKAGGHTMFRKLANLTDSIYVIDNRGLDSPETEQAIKEIGAQLDGERGYGERVEWEAVGDSDDSDEDIDLFIEDTNTGHNISCAVLVFSAKHDIAMSMTGISEVVNFIRAHQGSDLLAVITHVDVAEKAHVENLKSILQLESGVSEIFEVANITGEKARLEELYEMCLLSLIKRCMSIGVETIIFKHNQRKEWERIEEAKRRRREKERQEMEERRRLQEQERRAREKRRRREEERKIEAERRRMEQDIIEMEYQMRMEQERQRREMEMERQQLAAQERERQAREREREQRHIEEMRRAEANRQMELRRVRLANQRNNNDDCVIL